jgi:AcrR family transcriptional regulator
MLIYRKYAYKRKEDNMMKVKAADDKKVLKKQRIKTYFLEAAKEIIMNDGVENISVRKVADIAGYSYATIYNYFTDLNELLWEVKKLMINDIFEELQKKNTGTTKDIEGIKKGFRIYVEYFFENPNVFKFFYFHHLAKPDSETGGAGEGPDFDEMWSETLKEFVLSGKLRAEEIEALAKTLIYAIHGLVTLCFSGNGDLTEENVYSDLDKIIEYILGRS